MSSFDSFCGSTFLNLTATWHTQNPQISECFQLTVCYWIPCAFLFLITPYYGFHLIHKKGSAYHASVISVMKKVVAGIMSLITASNLMLAVSNKVKLPDVADVKIVTYSVLLATLIVVLWLLWLEQRHGEHSSGFMFNFWILLLICNIGPLYYHVQMAMDYQSLQENVVDFSLFVIWYCCVIIEFILSMFYDGKPLSKVDELERPSCPEDVSGFLSKVSFSWFTGLIVRGYRKSLTVRDFWQLNEKDLSKELMRKFNYHWDRELKRTGWSRDKIITEDNNSRKERSQLEVEMLPLRGHRVSEAFQKKKPSIVRCLFFSFGSTFLFGSFFKLLQDCLLFVGPYILQRLLPVIENSKEPSWHGYMFAVVLFLCSCLQTFFLHQYFHRAFVTGMRTKSAIITAVYTKALKLTSSARKGATIGEIVNLMTVDAQRFQEILSYINMIWSAPFQICVSLYMLWRLLGPSIFAGVAVLIVMLPVNALTATFIRKYQVEQMKLKDERVKLINEILSGIKLLKLYAWEPAFEKQVSGIRVKEIFALRKIAYWNTFSTFAWVLSPFVVSLTTFAVYVNVSEASVLTAERAFVGLSLFNILRFPMSVLPNIISGVIQARVSVQRVNKFMRNSELDPDNVLTDRNAPFAVEISNGTFSWFDPEEVDKDANGVENGKASNEILLTKRRKNSLSMKPILENVCVELPRGQFLAVIGKVGSGKSSLLSALLGEMYRLDGRVVLGGSVAYVSQQPWIKNCSLKENILFGSPYNENLYSRVIEACSLLPDLAILPGGDETEIGEKGINLSGGQKLRVSLARALYQNADIYLLDDPLSAVDANVGKHIFEHVIGGANAFLSKKTRIVVTHGLSILPRADKVILMEGGTVECGTYRDLLERNGDFALFIQTYLESLKEDDDVDEYIEELKETFSEVGSSSITRSKSRLLSFSSVSIHSDDGVASLSQSLSSLDKQKPTTETSAKLDPEKLIAEEKVETGRVKLRVFMTYIRAVGFLLSATFTFLYALNSAARMGTDVWLSRWSDDTGAAVTEKKAMRLGVYGALGLLQITLFSVAALIMAYGFLRASRIIHERLLYSVMRAPHHFFSVTPQGRVLNRFGHDIDVIDLTIVQNFRSLLLVLFSVLSIVIIISVTTPIFLAALFPIGVLYILLQRFYVASSRQMKRLESITRSPIYSHFGESIQGVSVIRAYGKVDEFIQQNMNKVDENLTCYYPSIVSNRWLAIRLELLANTMVLFAASFAVMNRDSLSAGLVGLSVSYALSITQSLNWVVRMTSELETNIVSVERVEEYSKLELEADWDSKESAKPPSDWPKEGNVKLVDFCLRYREDLPLTLNNISLDIKGGEKVAVVGRTGAGKSSLTLGLFRIVEKAGGQILIDGLDISSIGLHDLRNKLAIIPQDPILFTGTLRMNLDPFDVYDDAMLWDALKDVSMEEFVQTKADGLSFVCDEGGSNLSVGQRQLVCMARALLRKSKILVLDEATAAVDLETDDFIQKSIRSKFRDCTVITIAHRLVTILDYDKILVLSEGVVQEFDTPENLMNDEESAFFNMAESAGITSLPKANHAPKDS